MAEYKTADGVRVVETDEVFDYYSMELVVIGTPAGSDGWFNTLRPDGSGVRSASGMLNGDRICTPQHAKRMGWLD